MIREIVAIRSGSRITNNISEIISACHSSEPFDLLDRTHMKFMAALDLGERWEKLASGKTLFLLDTETGKLSLPEAK